MRILVIGSEGFIGRHLMEQGCAIGHEMIGLDVAGAPDIRLNASSVDCELLRVWAIKRVIDCAGVLGTQETFEQPALAVGVNVLATLSLLKTCLTSLVPFTYLTLGNNWLNPYSITKNCAAEFVRMFNVVHGLPTQVAVCYNVFGPFQKWKPVRKIVPEFMTRLIDGKHIELFDCGEQLVDMVYAPDLARAVIGSVGVGVEYYGSGVPRRVKEVAADCAAALGKPLNFVNLGKRPGETGPAAIAPEGLPNQTPYEDALNTTARWYQDNYKP